MPAALHKPLIETSYLTAQNVARYRIIMRCFYQQHQRLRYWLRPEDVHQGALTLAAEVCPDEFAGYTQEQCQKDLDALVAWKNLIPRHDGGRSNTIEEYLRRRFRYQMTPYSVEIERLVAGLENLRGFGGSLEPSLFDDIAAALAEVQEAQGAFAPGKALSLWRSTYQTFDNLTRGAADYIASLQTSRAEELMLTESFLAFKASLTSYLQDFVRGLQRGAPRIDAILGRITCECRGRFLACVQADQAAIPQLDEEPLAPDEQSNRLAQEWDNVARWFSGAGDQGSEVSFLEQRTKDTIARVVRYALRIQEKQRSGLSRRRELEHLGLWFFSLTSLDEAHELAANVFGIYRVRHFQGIDAKDTDSADISMWEAPPNLRALRSRSRQRLRDSGTAPIVGRPADIRRARAEHFRDQESERELLRGFMAAGKVRVSDLAALDPFARARLLSWIGACHANKSRRARIAEGVVIGIVAPPDGRRAVLRGPDGDLEMPDYDMIFQGPDHVEGRMD